MVNFSEEWDKLKNRKVGGLFTTARGYTGPKETYYNGLQGNLVPITLNKKKIRLQTES